MHEEFTYLKYSHHAYSKIYTPLSLKKSAQNKMPLLYELCTSFYYHTKSQLIVN